jgi:hypothetical protein
MTITIPAWLVYAGYAACGVVALIAVAVVLGFAYMGWVFVRGFSVGR